MLGFINVYKPEGITSNAVVQKIKKKFNIKKIGHLGTLDPIACGVLPVAIGKATRLFDYALDKVKTYEVIYDIGFTTDSLDTTGNITNAGGIIPDLQKIIDVLPEFLGESDQVPPNFSAKNVNGKRAYDLARLGVEFELKPKRITIYDFKYLNSIDVGRHKFSITCSSGTYIRAIGRDLASRLGTYACMSFLERVETGNFKASDSIKLDDLLMASSLNDFIKSPLNIFDNFNVIEINESLCTDLRNGKQVKFGKIDNNTFVVCKDCLIGIIKPNLNATKLDTYLEE